MQIVIIEKDPFTRTDLVEALTQQFPIATLVTSSSLASLDFSGRPDIVLMDRFIDQASNTIIEVWVRSGIPIIITNDIPRGNTSDMTFLNRPFTGEMLCQAVDKALKCNA